MSYIQVNTTDEVIVLILATDSAHSACVACYSFPPKIFEKYKIRDSI